MMIVLVAALAVLHATPPAPFEVREVHRLQRHFDDVLVVLAERDVAALSPSAQVARARHLAELRRYRDAGVFPQNRSSPVATPIFVDDAGRACAVGHLLLQDGQASLVAEIVASQNLARVPQLRAARLGPWAETNGFTVAELAHIQPTYERSCERNTCVSECCEESNSCRDSDESLVCGEDGVNYGSVDIARNCGTAVASQGACPLETSNCAAAGHSSLSALAVLLFACRRRWPRAL